ncbi:hypothetical protein OAN22_00280 [Alphaproteobacteria bacterium]|nr:hypothetical protein [Alphaproteobacteria bacterium]
MNEPLGRTLDVAEQVLTVAKRLTGTEQPEKALERLTLDPQLQVKFQEALISLERETIMAEVTDRMNARERDLQLTKLGRSNRRADIMVISAAIGLVSCLVVLGWFHEKISGEAVGILSTISGVFGACLKDAFSFEFGRFHQPSGPNQKFLERPIV